MTIVFVETARNFLTIGDWDRSGLQQKISRKRPKNMGSREMIEKPRLFPAAYQKNKLWIAAITMHRMGANMERICSELGLSEADVYEALAAFKRAEEREEE